MRLGSKMASPRLRAAALLLLAAGCCVSQPAPSRSARPLLTRLRRSSSSHYCGSHLASMLELVCGVSSVGKRANHPGNTPDYAEERRANGLGALARALEVPPFGSRARLLEHMDPLQRESRSIHPGGPDRFRVKRQGIVYECCFNACSISVLQSYCNS
ncbi:hypothetical protein FJT64_006588 [Amphibalanus amphitrite]|uniref:Insulin-like domain-containing protein n=1 Tax=Amphibalanus amphitrite TaxID=1232801 RepID=A0A6A4VWJ8_AMPAM|nr:hypothetical protein FJT64_006588 [Amphibalanus amphitrite]